MGCLPGWSGPRRTRRGLFTVKGCATDATALLQRHCRGAATHPLGPHLTDGLPARLERPAARTFYGKRVRCRHQRTAAATLPRRRRDHLQHVADHHEQGGPWMACAGGEVRGIAADPWQSAQLCRQPLRLDVGVALEHCEALVTSHARDFHDAQVLLEQPRRCFVAQVMEAQVG